MIVNILIDDRFVWLLIKVEKELDELKIYHAEVIEARKHLKVENAKLEKENTLN